MTVPFDDQEFLRSLIEPERQPVNIYEKQVQPSVDGWAKALRWLGGLLAFALTAFILLFLLGVGVLALEWLWRAL